MPINVKALRARFSGGDSARNSSGDKLEIGAPISFRHEGHIGTNGVASNFSNAMDGQLAAAEVEWLGQIARASKASRDSSRSTSSDSLPDSGSASAKWAKARAAASFVGSLQHRRKLCDEELRRVGDELRRAEEELHSRRCTLAASDASVQHAAHIAGSARVTGAAERQAAAQRIVASSIATLAKAQSRVAPGSPAAQQQQLLQQFQSQPSVGDELAGSNGWLVVQDESSGSIYYYHPESGQTSWDDPRIANAAASAEDYPLPDGWEEIYDPGSNACYFYNVSTGDTSWERPGSAAGSSAPVESHNAGTGASAIPAGPEVPMLKAMGVYSAQESEVDKELAEIKDAVAAGDFEQAIKLRDNLRVAKGKLRNSVHAVSAEL